jgi:hypothetical protein
MRLSLFVTGGIFCLGMTCGTPSHAAEQFHYVIEAANQIKEIEYSKTVLGDEENGRIARIACDTLSRLIEDKDFGNALADMLSEGNRKVLKGTASKLIEDLSNFNDVFISAELDNMHRAGLDYPVIVSALDAASRRRVGTNTDLSAGEVLKQLDTARQAVCEMARGIVSARQRAVAQWTISGVVLIVVDTSGAIGIAAASSGVLAVAAGAVFVASIDIGANVALSGVRGDVR